MRAERTHSVLQDVGDCREWFQNVGEEVEFRGDNLIRLLVPDQDLEWSCLDPINLRRATLSLINYPVSDENTPCWGTPCKILNLVPGLVHMLMLKTLSALCLLKFKTKGLANFLIWLQSNPKDRSPSHNGWWVQGTRASAA